MPELPEVETLRRELRAAIEGKTIKSAEVRWAKIVKPLTPKNFNQKLKNKKIIAVDRRAKVLILKLSNDDFLLIHLKLTGQLIYIPYAISHKSIVGGHPQKCGAVGLPNKFTHIIITFKDGSKLYFNDLRKFGWMRIVNKLEVDKLLSEFGVEPLNKEFTFKKFEEILKKYPSRKIKKILMDQTLIAGVGNIYADESCFCAGLLPMRLARQINSTERQKLFNCIKRILKLAISKKGTSADTYLQLNGRPGRMASYLKVYGRRGERCSRCGGLVSKIKLNGRGTHFCQQCQK